MIAIRGVEVSHLIRRTFVRGGTHGPANIRDRSLRAHNFKSRRPKEWHREEAREAHFISHEPDVDREAFDQILAIVTVVKSTCAKE